MAKYARSHKSAHKQAAKILRDNAKIGAGILFTTGSKPPFQVLVSRYNGAFAMMFFNYMLMGHDNAVDVLQAVDMYKKETEKRDSKVNRNTMHGKVGKFFNNMFKKKMNEKKQPTTSPSA